MMQAVGVLTAIYIDDAAFILRQSIAKKVLETMFSEITELADLLGVKLNLKKYIILAPTMAVAKGIHQVIKCNSATQVIYLEAPLYMNSKRIQCL